MECRIYLLLQGILPYLERGAAGAESALPATMPSAEKTRQEQKERRWFWGNWQLSPPFYRKAD